MATGASNADLAVILIDARKGVLTQTRRHAYIVSLLGIRNVVLAVNKIDLVGYFAGASSTRSSRTIAPSPSSSASPVVPAIPLSALDGDNVIAPSDRTPWYDGPRCCSIWKRVDVDDRRQAATVPPAGAMGQPPQSRFPRLCRHHRRRHACSRGDARARLAQRQNARRSRASSPWTAISTEAVAGQAVTLTLADEIDIARGDVLCAPDAPPGVADQFAAHAVWMADEPMLPGRPYLLKIGTAHRAAPRSPSSNTRSTSTRSSIWRPRRWSSTRSAVQFRPRPAARLRSLRRQPRHRRLHPDRPLHQRHGRRRHDRFRAAPRRRTSIGRRST